MQELLMSLPFRLGVTVFALFVTSSCHKKESTRHHEGNERNTSEEVGEAAADAAVPSGGRMRTETGMEVFADDGYFVQTTVWTGVEDPNQRISSIRFGVVEKGSDDSPDKMGEVFLEINVNGWEIYSWKEDRGKLIVSRNQSSSKNKLSFEVSIPRSTLFEQGN